jgi:hypothetical protein
MLFVAAAKAHSSKANPGFAQINQAIVDVVNGSCKNSYTVLLLPLFISRKS